MKRKNILAQKSMKNKQKVTNTSNGGESEKISQFSTLEINISQNMSGTIGLIQYIFTMSFFFVQ